MRVQWGGEGERSGRSEGRGLPARGLERAGTGRWGAGVGRTEARRASEEIRRPFDRLPSTGSGQAGQAGGGRGRKGSREGPPSPEASAGRDDLRCG